jgi:hypothetical protein
MEKIDRKYIFRAISINSGKKYTQNNAIIFLAKDELLPSILDKYIELLITKNADERQIKGVELLKDRVLTWQRKYEKKVSLPNVQSGKEEKNVCKPNKC